MGSANHCAARPGAAHRRHNSPQAWPDERLEQVWDQFDQGTQRAILRLHRSIDQPASPAPARTSSELWMPALVLWGERDPWLTLHSRTPTRSASRAPNTNRSRGRPLALA